MIQRYALVAAVLPALCRASGGSAISGEYLADLTQALQRIEERL
jgi:hypothetical protein